MRLTSIYRYWNTLKYLRLVQFYGRLWFRFYRPRPSLKCFPRRRPDISGWQRPAQREPSLFGVGEFLFLNERGNLNDIGWDGEERNKLWRYNQHYFDDLNSLSAEERREWHQSLLQGWVDNNPIGVGTGWEPYPTSLRIVNWVKAAFSGYEHSTKCEVSLAVQARWLKGRLEIHLLGNHLFANAKALVFAGCYFTGSEAESWVARGLLILQKEAQEQILSDGGHFERSTMYHSLALEDMLDLLNVLEAVRFESPDLTDRANQFAQLCREKIPSMMHWMDVMSHPDGDIALFNDAAFGIGPSPCRLNHYGERLGFKVVNPGEGLKPLVESGYYRLTSSKACVLFDAAPIGPDYLPGHAHADTLSLELSLHGKRVFVNSGTSEYGVSDERLRQRGTAAHNTVEVDGKDSSEVWSGFRVARRAYPYAVKYTEGEHGQSVTACHDGYHRLSPSISVCRTVDLMKDSLTITDVVQGNARSAIARFFLHPAVDVSEHDASTLRLRLPEGEEYKVEFIGAQKVSVSDSTWHPRFGVTENNLCIKVEFSRDRLVTRLSEGQF